MNTLIAEKIKKRTGKPSGVGYFIARKLGKAINDYNMIKDGDRVLVGVSGGKDSMTLLALLHERKKWVPIDYEIIAAHVQTDFRCSECVHEETLRNFFEGRKYKYVFDKVNILKNPDGTTNKVNCFWCSWNRRKSLFTLASKLKCNRVAFGHHRDDIAQTTLLNLFFHGEISTMSPKVNMFEGELDIIRPLAYVDEKHIVKYAKQQNFPSQLCRCPYGQNSQRRQIKNMINEVEKVCPNVKLNIFNSMKRIKKEYLA